MRRFWLRRPPAPPPPGKHACEATERLDAITDMLLARQATGHVHVSVSEMLDLTDPGHEKREKRSPLADPLTGAMPTDPAAYEKEDKPPPA